LFLCSYIALYTFFSYLCVVTSFLNSFPTRRSSDLFNCSNMTGSIKSLVEDSKERVEHYQKKRSDGGRLDLESMDKACWREIWWRKEEQNCKLQLRYVVVLGRLLPVLDPSLICLICI